jgi:single-stranded-DNA-specific exonuclease
VIGIVAARIAERHHRPAVLIALEGDEGTGSGRSIPAFDLLGGLHAGAEWLERYGGHRAAAGVSLRREHVDTFREAFCAHAGEVLAPEDLVPEVRVDAVVQGDALSLSLAEELERLAPFGMGNPAVSLLVPSAQFADPRPLGEGRHVAFTLQAGGARSRCVSFGAGSGLPVEPGLPADAAVRLEIDRWNGAVSPRLVLRHAAPCRAGRIDVLGEPASFAAGVCAELDRDLAGAAGPVRGGARELRDVRGTGIAGLLGDLVATGEPVLVVTAHAPHRARALAPRVGGFAVTSWAAVADDPGLAAPFAHVVALDPPAGPLLDRPSGEGWTHLAWGKAELDFAVHVHEWNYALRDPLAALYRALRGAGGACDEACEALLRGDGREPRTAALAGRLVRVLAELALVAFERAGPALRVGEAAGRTALERSAAYVAYQRRLEDGRQFLTSGETQSLAA